MSKYVRTGMMACMFMVCSLALSQKPDHNKIKALKVAFLTERLSLTSSEAEIFWPMYNTYEDQKDGLRERERNEIHSKSKASAQISEKEANTLLDKYLKLEEEQEELDKVFYKKMAGSISARKTLMLFNAEHEFRKQLIRQYSCKHAEQEKKTSPE